MKQMVRSSTISVRKLIMFRWITRNPRKYVTNDADQDNVSIIKLFLKMISKNKSDLGPSVWRHIVDYMTYIALTVIPSFKVLVSGAASLGLVSAGLVSFSWIQRFATMWPSTKLVKKTKHSWATQVHKYTSHKHNEEIHTRTPTCTSV